MKKVLVPALVLVLGSVALGATVFREQVARAAPGIQDVFVTNSTREPVPVHEQGTADVNVTNAPLAVRAAGETPVQRELPFSFGGSSAAAVQYHVPAGKRLLMKLVTFYDSNNPFVLFSFTVGTTVSGNLASHYLSSSKSGTHGDVVSAPVEIYADPGSTVFFRASLTSPYHGTLEGSFSGVLIDAP